MTYTRLQNYTNQVVGKYGIQTFKVVVVVMLLLLLTSNIFAPISAHPLLFFEQVICRNVLKCQI